MARTAIHLAEQLEALDMSSAELARQIQVPTNRITSIFNGQRAITGDTALRLWHYFGTSAEFWLNLQKLYELAVPNRKPGVRHLLSVKKVMSYNEPSPFRRGLGEGK